jgi:hypothetical protein
MDPNLDPDIQELLHLIDTTSNANTRVIAGFRNESAEFRKELDEDPDLVTQGAAPSLLTAQQSAQSSGVNPVAPQPPSIHPRIAPQPMLFDDHQAGGNGDEEEETLTAIFHNIPDDWEVKLLVRGNLESESSSNHAVIRNFSDLSKNERESVLRNVQMVFGPTADTKYSSRLPSIFTRNTTATQQCICRLVITRSSADSRWVENPWNACATCVDKRRPCIRVHVDRKWLVILPAPSTDRVSSIWQDAGYWVKNG